MNNHNARSYLFVCLMMCIGIAACSAKYTTQNLSGTEKVLLEKNKSIFISIPQDGFYETKQYFGSGQDVAQAVASAFSHHATQVTISEKQLSKDQSIVAAQAAHADYVVIPVITHWEHRATEWSARPSLISLQIYIIDSKTGKQLTIAGIDGRSRIISFTRTDPKSLLRTPLAKYVDSIY
ncbi:MAG: DUF4823 domain-containing protein [Ottowia sp.]|nr:DUF4823 domain-containing protein [Ottowia sp.]